MPVLELWEADYGGVFEMSEIISLRDYRQKKLSEYGEQNWMLCHCQEGVAQSETPAGFVPAMIHDAQGAFIAAMMCTVCGNEMFFDGGRLMT